MKITAEPRSDQWNAEDFIGGPRTFTIAGVRGGTAEQKYDILLAGEDRVWRPPLTVLRLLMAGWGDDADVWTGRQVTLYNDPAIRFGKDLTGGIRISHMSNLPDGKPLRKSLQEARGKRKTHVIDPLPDAPAQTGPTPQDLAEQIVSSLPDATTEAEVREWGNRAHARNLLDVQVNGETVKSHVEYRLAELAQTTDEPASQS